MNRWTLAGVTRELTAGKIPDVGRVIVWLSSRKAWRVDRVDDVHPANWSAQTAAVWAQTPGDDWETWPGRERRVGVEPARNPAPNGKGRGGIRLCPWWNGEQWAYLEDPWPECVDCRCVWPCPCRDANQAAEAAMGEIERLGQILPGCCWACSEPIVGRQRSIVFDGENLLLPGAGPVVFHTAHSRKAARGTCRGEAERYEERWVFAGENRTVRLTCPGVLWSHFGYRECTNPVCPGENATHRNGFVYCATGYGVWHADGSYVKVMPLTNCNNLGCKGPTDVTIPERTPDQ